MSNLMLVRPHIRYKDTYLASVQEFLAENRHPSWNVDMLEAHFDEYVQMLLEKEYDPFDGFSPEQEYWSIVGNEFVGHISIRQQLVGNLINFGGHIGYDIRPSARKKGYGTEQCRLAILQARAWGIGRILITCDDNNMGSIKIIETNGGILENKRDNGRVVLTRRYWVE